MSYESDVRAGYRGGMYRDTQAFREGQQQRWNEEESRRERESLQRRRREEEQLHRTAMDLAIFRENSPSIYREGGGEVTLTIQGCAKFFGAAALSLTIWYGLTHSNWSILLLVLYSVISGLVGAVGGAIIYVIIRVTVYVLAFGISACVIMGIVHIFGIVDATAFFQWLRSAIYMFNT